MTENPLPEVQSLRKVKAPTDTQVLVRVLEPTSPSPRDLSRNEDDAHSSKTAAQTKTKAKFP